MEMLGTEWKSRVPATVLLKQKQNGELPLYLVFGKGNFSLETQ